MKKIAVVLTTYDGIVNSYCGIGTSCRSFVSAFPTIKDYFEKQGIKLSLHLITPALSKESLGYSEEIKSESVKLAKLCGGSVHYILNNTDGMVPYGNIENWKVASSSAASMVLDISENYDETIAFFVDTPFMQAPLLIEKQINAFNNKNITSVLFLESDVLIHEPENPNKERLEWESNSIKILSKSKTTKFADIGTFMTDHLKSVYGLKNENFVPLTLGINPQQDRFREYSEEEIKLVLEKYNIPQDKDIIFSVGRAVDYKGFDILIKSFSQIKSDAHLVFVASPYKTEMSCVNELSELIKETKISCTPVFDCDFYLPSVICQWKRTKIVAQLARYEPFGLVPEEARIWGKNGGPVVLASNRDGFIEQITDDKDGFLIDIEDDKKIAEKMDYILQMDKTKFEDVRKLGFKTFQEKYDFRVSLFKCVNSLTDTKSDKDAHNFISSLTY